MTKLVAHYDKMAVLYGKDRAIEEHAETASELRKRLHTSIDLEHVDSIDDIDKMFNTNEVTIDAANSCHDDTQTMSVGSTEVWSKNKEKMPTKKSKKSKAGSKNEGEFIGDAILSVADALREGNNAYLKVKLPTSMREDEVWQFVQDLGIEDDDMEKTYAFLLDKPDKLKALLGVPEERRRSLLMFYMHGSTRGN